MAREYWRFPLVFTPSGLLNSLGSQLPILIVVSWYGAASAGQLGMARRLVFIPASLIGVPIGQVFAAEMAKKLRNGEGALGKTYLRTSAYLSLVAFVVTVALLVVDPWLFPLFLGDDWSQSGKFAQAMALSVGFGLVVSPVSTVFALFQRSLPSIIVDLARVRLIVSGTVIATVLRADAVTTAWLYGALSVNYLFTWAYGYAVVVRLRSGPRDR